MVRVTEGLGGNAVEVHDLSGVNPPQVVEYGYVDMNQGMWGMGRKGTRTRSRPEAERQI